MIKQNINNYWNKRIQQTYIQEPISQSYQYQNLIDIIIPVYNDRQGLYQTLFSLNIYHRYNVIIVDDCSTDSYNDIIDFFQQFLNITLVQTPSNGGPAVAKNYGASFATSKYLMFLDAGDTLIHSNILTICEKELEYNHATFLCSDIYEEKQDGYLQKISNDHNMWMGKIYNRDFYIKHNLRYSEESSFCNDDIGMNMLVRLLLPPQKIVQLHMPTIIWHLNDNSVSSRNTDEYMNKNFNFGTAHGAIYAINEAYKFNCNETQIQELVCSVICQMYYNYLGCLMFKPEYKEFSFNGAKLFYDTILRNDKDTISMTMLTDFYNITSKNRYTQIVNDSWEAYGSIIPFYSFTEFLDDLENSI